MSHYQRCDLGMGNIELSKQVRTYKKLEISQNILKLSLCIENNNMPNDEKFSVFTIMIFQL